MGNSDSRNLVSGTTRYPYTNPMASSAQDKTVPRDRDPITPSDSLTTVFPPSILATLIPQMGWDAEHPLRIRYEVLMACGPYPSDRVRRWKLKVRRAQKAALEAYMDAALALDLLDAEMLG